MWCIPPQQDARFVAAMEDVLEVYERPYDPERPLVCLDEGAKQILSEVRVPLPLKPASLKPASLKPASAQVERYDNEYERQGTCALFMLSQPLVGQREVLVRDRRTARDYAEVVRHLCDEVHPQAQAIVLVQDNLNIRPEGTRALGACMKRFLLKRRNASHSASNGTTRLNMALGSTWPRSNWGFWRASVCKSGCRAERTLKCRCRRGKHAAMRLWSKSSGALVCRTRAVN